MREHSIAVIGGDTIGPELVRQAVKALQALTEGTDVRIDIEEILACGPAIRKTGDPLPEEEAKKLRNCRAVLLGNVGSRAFASLPPGQKPEQALLRMRREIGVCTNLRPVFVRKGMEAMSPLKYEYLEKGFDVVIVRDIGGGLLAGNAQRTYDAAHSSASDLEYYSEETIRLSAELAFDIARHRRRAVCSLDKANVLYSSVLWRETVAKIGKMYPGIELTHRYVDAAAMDVIRQPGAYDVLLTNNVFGDIIADELTELSGMPAVFGSAEISADGRGIYTPNQLHTDNESMEGKGEASPEGILHAVSMMLARSLGERALSVKLERAIGEMYEEKLTAQEAAMPGFSVITTDEYGDRVAALCR